MPPLQKTRLQELIPSVLGVLILIEFCLWYFLKVDRAWGLGLLAAMTLVSFMIPLLRVDLYKYLLTVLVAHAALAALRPWPYIGTWPANLFLVSAVTWLAMKYGLKNAPVGVRWNWKFSRGELLSVVIITVPSIFILYWYYATHPEVVKQFTLPALETWAMPLVILGSAALNGLREELVYRILFLAPFLHGRDSRVRVGFLLVSQALLFGFLHYTAGFPQGWLGVAMTATWGFAIGVQYWLFRSATLAWLTHSVADAIMFTIIVLNRA